MTQEELDRWIDTLTGHIEQWVWEVHDLRPLDSAERELILIGLIDRLTTRYYKSVTSEEDPFARDAVGPER